MGINEAKALAYEYCDTDGNGCLTWDEVQVCIADYGIDLPLTKEDFEAMAGEDGCLEEWEWDDGIDRFA